MTPRPVLLVTPTLQRGGAERHVVTMATTLDPERWTPHVLALADGPLHTELVAAGVDVTVAGTGHGLGSLPAATAAVREAVGRVSPAVVSVHDVLGELACRAVVRTDPRSLLVWKHTYGHVGHRGFRDRLVERTTGRLVTRYAAVCHTQVRYLTDELGLDPRRITVVANTVEPLHPAPMPSGAPVAVMVAAMRADKGHDTALHAWRTVVDAAPTARLLLVGDGPLRGEIAETVGRLGLDHHVEFVGEVTGPVEILQRAHVGLLASSSVECFPYAVLEAMSIGRGVVSTNVGGLPELVDDGVSGLLVPPHDPQALAGALLHALTTPGVAADLGAAAHARLQRVFPFDRWRAATSALLEHCAGSSEPTRDHLVRTTA
ncbi:glycosyltransferase [Jatrophihabitans sp. YIM 134969]